MKKCTSYEGQKGTRKIRENVYFRFIVFSCLWSTKPCLRFLFILFCLGDKRLLSEFLRKWGWFHGHNERFTKYLAKKLKFQKTETRFCRWKSTDNSNINIFLSLENPLLVKQFACVHFCLWNNWRRIIITNSELSQNRTEKHCFRKFLMLFVLQRIEKENSLLVVLYHLQLCILLSLRLVNSFDKL